MIDRSVPLIAALPEQFRCGPCERTIPVTPANRRARVCMFCARSLEYGFAPIPVGARFRVTVDSMELWHRVGTVITVRTSMPRADGIAVTGDAEVWSAPTIMVHTWTAAEWTALAPHLEAVA